MLKFFWGLRVRGSIRASRLQRVEFGTVRGGYLVLCFMRVVD